MKTAARMLKSACSNQPAYLARIGGDEFAIICSDCPAETACDIRNTIYELFEENNALSEVSYKLNISVGIAEFTDSMKDAQELIEAADKELYREKKRHHT